MTAVDYKHELKDLLDVVVNEAASDLHLSVGSHPIIRVAGNLMPLVKKPILTDQDVDGFAKVLLTKIKHEEFVQNKDTDFAYSHVDEVRFRGNIYQQRGTSGIALRLIPNTVKTFEELSLPPILESFAQRNQGFFLCVGAVGQGKSTTLASMVENINQNRFEHIVTIEDPVEYIYESKQSLIEQREVGVDAHDFEQALNAVFRQDIDVILVGEMRNAQTIGTAVTAAETGHLVLSTLHTNDAAQTIDRIIDSFPAGQQDQIRVQLAGSLLGIFSQRLIPRISGGLIPAYELLINNSAVANLIREKRTHEVQTLIETGLEHGMIDMNRTLVDLVKKGEITVENAFTYSNNPKGIERLM